MKNHKDGRVAGLLVRLFLCWILKDIFLLSVFAEENSSRENPFLTAEFHGRIAVDFGKISYSSPEHKPFNRNDVELRSLRLGLKGNIGQKLSYQIDVREDEGKAELVNLNLYYQPDEHWAIRVGQFKMINSLEFQTSSADMTVRERAGLTKAFDLERRVGVALDFRQGEWLGTLGYFFETLGNSGEQEKAVFSGRLSRSLHLSDDFTMHLGGSFFTRGLGGKSYSGSYDLSAHDHLDDLDLARSGFFLITGERFIAGEVGLVKGPLSLQAEGALLKQELSKSETALSQNPTYQAFYIEAGYFLIGEGRSYDRKKGRFRKAKPSSSLLEGGIGDIQMVFRYDQVNLQHEEGGNLFGNNQRSFILATNWYLTGNSRFVVSYAHSRISQSHHLQEKINSVGVRLELDW